MPPPSNIHSLLKFKKPSNVSLIVHHCKYVQFYNLAFQCPLKSRVKKVNGTSNVFYRMCSCRSLNLEVECIRNCVERHT